MSSLLDWFIDNPDLDPTDKTILGGLKRYGQFQAMERAGDYFLPDQDRDLDRELKRVQIAREKRAIGMDDSKTYEDSINSGSPLWAVTARHVLQRIPEAGFLGGGKPPLNPLFKIARSATPYDSIPGIAGRLIRAVG